MNSIADVIATMDNIEASLMPGDGVGCFNRLYRLTTLNIAAAVADGRFERPDFITRLDLDFAALYFQAYDLATAGQAPPRAWRPLFEHRHNPRIAPLLFAMSGMNAHINRDLAVAVTAAATALDLPVEPHTPWHRDFLLVNQILRETRAGAKVELSTGFVRTIDVALGEADDRFALWSLATARDAAWAHAEVLAALVHSPDLFSRYVSGLDQAAGLTGRALLGLRTPPRPPQHAPALA